jgi:hypothetical protein
MIVREIVHGLKGRRPLGNTKTGASGYHDACATR